MWIDVAFRLLLHKPNERKSFYIQYVKAISGTTKVGAVLAVIFSTTLLALNSYTKNYDLGELSQKHRQAGADLWLIRERYLSMIADLRMNSKHIQELIRERDIIVSDLHSVYSGAPSTGDKAYRKAQEALQKLDELTFSDHEIDAFLPKELRRV